MEVVVKVRAIKLIKNRLTLCEHIRSELAREVLSDATPKPRKVAALVERASQQTKAAALLRRLEELQSEPKDPPPVL